MDWALALGSVRHSWSSWPFDPPLKITIACSPMDFEVASAAGATETVFVAGGGGRGRAERPCRFRLRTLRLPHRNVCPWRQGLVRAPDPLWVRNRRVNRAV